jgi:hypothetical protein|nr:MAG TPA: hypothetical protein [Caudoviricetes sp.]DAN97664.1 MAG TPA: hypothetical protein [Caudoviricetes sp.]
MENFVKFILRKSTQEADKALPKVIDSIFKRVGVK